MDSDRAASETPILTWTSHPVRRRMRRGLAVLLAILILASLIGIWSRSVVWGLFSAIVLFLSLEGFYLPTRYELTDVGVRSHRTFSRSAREWSAFRRVFEDGFGLTLSPFRGRRWLEPYRALRLLYDGWDRSVIRAVVRERISRECDWIGPRREETDGAVGTGPSDAAQHGAG